MARRLANLPRQTRVKAGLLTGHPLAVINTKDMLNPFPGLLDFVFFAPTLLRIAAAACFFFIAYAQWIRRDELAHTVYPLIGKAPWLAPASVVAHALIGLMLLAGWYTQFAALIGLAASFKAILFAKTLPRFVPLCRGEYILLMVILASLMLSGAGALAYDLPL